LIVNGRGETAPRSASEMTQFGALRGLLKSPSMWALALTQGCAGYTLYLFMTWLPSYLAATRNMDVLKTGLFSAIPYGVAAILGLVWLVQRQDVETIRILRTASGEN